MKQLVILDLDNTIYDERDYFSGVFESYEQICKLRAGTLLKAFDSVSRDKSRDILKDTLIAASLYTLQNHDILFLHYCSAKFNLTLPNTSLKFIEQLRNYHIPLVILTNGVVEVQKNKVRNMNIEKFVYKIFYARDNSGKYEKPDLRCFQRVLKFFDCQPENAIMVGDSYSNDYLGAKNANIDALWLGGNNHESIDELEQALPFILEQNNEKN